MRWLPLLIASAFLLSSCVVLGEIFDGAVEILLR